MLSFNVLISCSTSLIFSSNSNFFIFVFSVSIPISSCNLNISAFKSAITTCLVFSGKAKLIKYIVLIQLLPTTKQTSPFKWKSLVVLSPPTCPVKINSEYSYSFKMCSSTLSSFWAKYCFISALLLIPLILSIYLSFAWLDIFTITPPYLHLPIYIHIFLETLIFLY